MNEYIVRLTSNLIGRNDFDEAFFRCTTHEEFINHVRFSLLIGDIEPMTPAKVGEIMGSFEFGDVLASKADIFTFVTFRGYPGEMQKETLAVCLAFAIYERLRKVDRNSGIPLYEGKRAEYVRRRAKWTKIT